MHRKGRQRTEDSGCLVDRRNGVRWGADEVRSEVETRTRGNNAKVHSKSSTSKNSINHSQDRAERVRCRRRAGKQAHIRKILPLQLSLRTPPARSEKHNPFIDCPKMMYYFQTRKIQRSNASNRCRGRNGSNRPGQDGTVDSSSNAPMISHAVRPPLTHQSRHSVALVQDQHGVAVAAVVG